VRVAESSVSSRHARLSWQRGHLVLEDLGSANGTYVDGQRITQPTAIQVGQDVRLGSTGLPWNEEALRAFLRHGASDTVLAMPRFGRYRCPKCGKLGILPPEFKQGELSCSSCGTELLFGKPPRNALSTALSLLASLLLIGCAVGAIVFANTEAGRALLSGRRATVAGVAVPSIGDLVDRPDAGPPIGASRTAGSPSPEERSIRESGVAARVMLAIDASAPTTRNLAVQTAAASDGPFHVEQVAAIWMHVRSGFDYVNDPEGAEYFATASETISNGFAGDCDDFSITLAAMVTAIGGRARVVIMDSDAGGHAYTEVCIDDEAATVASRLRTYVRRRWNRTLGRTPTLTRIHHRSDASCRVWLNLDWNVNYPGGPYGNERWAVAIRPDGSTETLAPATAP
jgi:pSer/pThr/pTyr-binding forkhead associated (FHA) protein